MSFLKKLFGMNSSGSNGDPMPTRPVNLPYRAVPENGQLLARKFTDAVFHNEGLVLDYSPGSLEYVDSFLQRFKDEGLKANDFAETVFVVGAYVGEVMVTTNNGSWISQEEVKLPDGVSMMPIVIKLPNGNIADPIAKAFKRFHYGEIDSVRYFYSVFTQ